MKTTSNKIEILAPAGDITSLKTAILAKADAIYCGLTDFNARKRAENFSFEEFQEAIILAHQHNCKIYLTLNTIIFEKDILIVKELLSKVTRLGIDGVIVQDLGIFFLIKELFPSLSLHASTQTTTHNKGQIEFLANLGVRQINFCRELSIEEIEELCNFSKRFNIKPEVFIHGALCISFSGQCYLSKILYNRSGNKGECIQPCRMLYICKETNKKTPFLNLKDLCAFKKLPSLIKAGVKTFKIEGRLRNRDYIYTVVKTYKNSLEKGFQNKEIELSEENLYKVFNRGFTSGYLENKISKEMFSNSSNDRSLIFLCKIVRFIAKDSIIEIDREIEIPYNTHVRIYSRGFTFVCTADIKERIAKNKYRLQITNKLKGKIRNGDYIYQKNLSDDEGEIEKALKNLQINKKKITIFIEGKEGEPLKVTFVTATRNIELTSTTTLTNAKKYPLTKEIIEKKLNLRDSPLLEISSIDCSKLAENLFLPMNELSQIKHMALEKLSKSNTTSDDVNIIIHEKTFNPHFSLNFSNGVFIDNFEDLSISIPQSSRFILELPSSLEKRYDDYIELFKSRKDIVPYFPSILIGKNYEMSIKFLSAIKPQLIITDNIGIGFEAAKNGIQWIAGHLLNIANSLAVKCIMKYGGCAGAFFSPELNIKEIKNIPVPHYFSKWYLLSSTSFLMSTRQCIIRNCIPCKKQTSDEDCLWSCNKSVVLQLQSKEIYVIKRKGFYTQLYFKKSNSFNFSLTNRSNQEVYIIDLRLKTIFGPSIKEALSFIENISNLDIKKDCL